MTDEGQHEASTSIDLPALRPILGRIAELVTSGFSNADADRIAAQTRALEVDAGSVHERFSVTFEGLQTDLEVTTRLDDNESCVVMVLTSAPLAEKVGLAM